MGIPRIVDGDLQFMRGMESSQDPATLFPGQYYYAENLVNRGGIPQTRPGTRTTFALPAGKLQGMTFFIPKKSFPELVAAVNGSVYVSQFPYTSYTKLQNIALSTRARDVFWCNASKSLDRNADGSLKFIVPRTVLMIQDGFSPAAYYDGSAHGHLTGPNKTPQGGPMVFTGNRLWVARDDKLFASDIEDPLNFTEQNYLGGLEAFLLPGQITGLAELPNLNAPQLLVFTKSSTTAFRSYIRDRLVWLNTPDFQRVVFPDIGCISHRSIKSHYGLLWWFSSAGLTSFDSAFMSLRSSKFQYRDNEMAESKGRLSDDLSTVCVANFENYLLCSVPFGDKYNRHTWVMDNSVIASSEDQLPASWNSVWTGFRPVEYAAAVVGAKNRIFCASVDHDGTNRVRELFQPSRRDDNCPISWSLASRGYLGGSFIKKRLRYVDFHLTEIAGVVDIRASWAGYHRGPFKTFLSKRIVASQGVFSPDYVVDAAKPLYALKKQNRTLRSEDAVATFQESEIAKSEVSSSDIDPLDRGFQLTISGSGECAIRGVQLYMDPDDEIDSGRPEPDETEEFNGVRFDGAESQEEENLEAFEPIYSATRSVTFSYKGVSVTGSGSARSTLSQADADKIAQAVAEEVASRKIQAVGPVSIGGYGS